MTLRTTRQPAAALALGRILQLSSRSAQPGDVAEYERCRAIIVDELAAAGFGTPGAYVPNYVRDRARGAAGD